MKYTFIDQHPSQFKINSMCRVLGVHRSGYYAWKTSPLSQRALEDKKLLVEIRPFHDDSYGIYGSPRIHRDLREAGIRCGVKRVARLMHQARIKSMRGYCHPGLSQGSHRLRRLTGYSSNLPLTNQTRPG